MNGKKRIYFYSGTHWDREWYQTFQGFRKRLVDAIDSLIDYLETSEDYGIFHMDGQTIVLEDYLEIMPHKKDRLAALIKSGKIVIGPWYNMPDEFLVSGESLIKNLRRGMRIARDEWDVEPSSNAYICDIFGHSSQTPQIFAGMGLYHTILGRGLNDEFDPVNFRWQALDGTEVLTYKLQDGGGYGAFAPFADNYPTATTPTEELDAALKDWLDREFARADKPFILIMDAVDHQPVRKDTPAFIAAIKRVMPDAEVYHTSVHEYQKEQTAIRDELEVRKGELINPAKVPSSYVHLITNTLSSRYYLKQYNDRNQTRLEKRIAPLYAFRQTGLATGYYDLAVKYLLQNHPHDSICGCSLDQVHQDMMYRFDQTAELCEEIERPLINRLASDLSVYAISEGEAREGCRLRIYNPLPYRGKRTVTAKVDLSSLPIYQEPFGYEPIPAFYLYDSEDNRLPYGYVKHHGNKVYEIAFEAELTPAGLTEFYLKPSYLPTRQPGSLLTSVRSAKGDYTEISINADGTLEMIDLETGEVYHNLLTLMDNCDIGDGWYHCAPLHDQLITPNEAEVAVTENNALRVTFCITQKMQLPYEVIYDQAHRRSAKKVDFCVTHEVTLTKREKGISVKTYLTNNACDHRLRLRLPTVVKGETYEAAQSFGYVTRKCGDDPTKYNWREYGVVEKNMAGICAKRNGQRGLAFISASGIHECGVWPNGDMDITLFRSTGRTVGGHLRAPGGQMLRALDFTYRILPFGEQDAFASLAREQDILATGLMTATVDGGKAQRYPSMLCVEGQGVVYSTAELLPDGASSVRVFNDSKDQTTATVALPAFATKASLVELDGRHLCDLTIQDGKIELLLPAFRIATVRFE